MFYCFERDCSWFYFQLGTLQILWGSINIFNMTKSDEKKKKHEINGYFTAIKEYETWGILQLIIVYAPYKDRPF